mgnify:CR=1 FL=1
MTIDMENQTIVQAAPAVLASREEALEAARSLALGIAARAEETEVGRSVPGQSIHEMMDAGLFGMVTVDRTTSIMIGAGDRLPTGLRDPAPDGPP